MATRKKTDQTLMQKRLRNDVKVLRYLLDNISQLVTGRLESPQKLIPTYSPTRPSKSLLGLGLLAAGGRA